jgi:hypothetical protein
MIGKEEILTRMAAGERLVVDVDYESNARCFMLNNGSERAVVDQTAARELFAENLITTDDLCPCGVVEYRRV